MDKYKCDMCIKEYSSYKSLWNHKKIKHTNNKNHKDIPNQLSVNDKKYKCKYCENLYNHLQSRWKHEKKCVKIYEKNESEKLLIKNKEIELRKLELENKETINHQLINIIVKKNKYIEELENKIDYNLIIENNKFNATLTLNNVIIISRIEDNYINATQLCQAGGKKFNHWYSLDSTKEIINELASETRIPVSQLVDIKKGNSNDFNQGSWIHPDLAIQLAQWISSKFTLQVSKWIHKLFNNVKLLEDKNKEIELKDQKIQLLQDVYIKKQKREKYSNKNVIYIVTTKENKKERIYIIGKAKDLTNRLSTYNKTSEHEVVYYKECKEENMNIIENMVLVKLDEYREKANRDRFILPIENNISLFTNIIDNCVLFLNNKISS
jgi:hypothetical protein